MTDPKVAVVFGASGIIGRNLAERLATSGSWEVVSVARQNHPTFELIAARVGKSER
jgi:NAD(P)-dependent dehydrogenase (short-subunit alcohol dehydrogenase family)